MVEKHATFSLESGFVSLAEMSMAQTSLGLFRNSTTDRGSRRFAITDFNQDTGFKSMALALLSRQFIDQTNNKKLQQVLREHGKLFPQRNHLSELALANTLRQCAVDEIVKRPRDFSGIFVNSQGKVITTREMRESHFEMNEYLLSALVQTLGLSVRVYEVNQSGDFPLTHYYGYKSSHPLTLRNENGTFTAETEDGRRLYPTRQLAGKSVLPTTIDLEIDEIAKLMKAEEQAVVLAFEEMYTRLSTMWVAGELSQETLLNGYFAMLSSSSSRSAWDPLFEKIRAQKEEATQSAISADVTDLFFAISRLFALKEKDAASIFEHLGEPPIRRNQHGF